MSFIVSNSKMSKPKNKRHKRPKSRRRSVRKGSKKHNTWLSTWNKFWKFIVGFGVIIAIVIGIKSLFFGDKIDQVIFNQPRFSEETTSFSFSFGESGISVGYSKDRLEKEAVYPYNFNEFKPVKLYIDNDVLYADISVYGGSNLPPIKITRNKLLGKPKNWDFNSDEKAIEIVNSVGKPVYQFYYKSPSHIVVNGVFPFPGGFIIAGPKGASVILNANVISRYTLKSIFKYPSWKYPGKYAEE